MSVWFVLGLTLLAAPLLAETDPPPSAVQAIAMDAQPPGRLSIVPEYFVETSTIPTDAAPLSIADVTRPEFDRFQPAADSRLNFGFIEEPVWIRFPVQVAANSAPRLIEIGFALIDQIELHVYDDAGQQVHSTRGGIREPFADRDRPYRYHVFELDLPEPGRYDVYLRLQTRNALVVPLTLWSEAGFRGVDHGLQFALGLYYGIVAVMVLYNLFLFAAIRDSSYIYYVGTLVALHGMFQLCIDGLVPEFLPFGFLQSGEAIARLTAASVCVGLVFALSFCRSFLNTASTAQRIDRVLRILSGLMLISMVAMFILDSYPVFQWIVFLGMVIVCWFLIAGFAALRAGYRPARFYLLAWFLLSIGGFLYGLKSMGWIPSTELTEYSLQVGLAIEAWLLSLALGDRLQVLKQGVIEAQDEALALEYRVREVEKLKDEIFALQSPESIESSDASSTPDAAEDSLGRLLEKIMQVLRDLLDFERGFIVVVDREDRLHWNGIGEIPTEPGSIVSGEEFIEKFLKMPADLFSYLNAVFFLRDGPARAADRPGAQPGAEHAETLDKMASILRSLESQGFQLAIPLFFRRQCFGYIVLGRKASGGAYDVDEVTILENFRLSLALAIRNAVLYEQIKRLRGRAEAKARRLSDYFSDMREVVKHRMGAKTLIFASERMAYLFELAQKYAKQTRQAVLITGPTGTGKELIAQAIHEHGSGADAPFVAINCAAVPAGLWETEIFGFEKGAFTDARSAHEGRVEQASGGTLFFDEIGEMPLSMQPKMLRLLQERSFQRVGGKRNKAADCRFVFATHRDLKELVAAGEFREDLYYRIQVLELSVPPLAERPDDIPILLNYFLQKYSQELAAQVRAVEPEAMEILMRYTWPGNIRELENAMIAALLHASNDTIRVSDLPAGVLSENPGESGSYQDQSRAITGAMPGGSYDELVRNYSRSLIQRTLEHVGGDKPEAARRLGIKRATFYYRLRELDIR